MRKVLLFSVLLVAGLIASQFLGGRGAAPITWLTLIGLSFIMIHVGYEFDLDKSRPRQYVWDYLVAGTAAAFPWIFCTLYFVYALVPRELWGVADQWKESLLLGRFASPTSAGVLFSMLAAAGLAATWVFKKARILAITVISNIGKMFPLVCYRGEAHWKERLALSIGMFPRGEVGAGVLVISLSYGLGGTALTVAVLSLGANLLLTGVFILWVRGLIAAVERVGEGSFAGVKASASGPASD